jgi:hypothetical protein
MTPPESLTKHTSLLLSWVFGLLVFTVGILLDLLLIDAGLTRSQTLIISNLITGLISGCALSLFLRDQLRRRAEEMRKIHVLEEMNHHIRNALQVVVFHCYAMGSGSSDDLRRAVDRIQWSLTDVLPKINFEHGSQSKLS